MADQLAPRMSGSVSLRRRSRSAHTVRVRRQERLAKGMLWVFSGLTIVTLFLIVGYILVNGFYTRDVEFATVFAHGEEVIPLGPDTEEELTLIVHPRIRLNTITYETLQKVVQDPTIKILKHTWGLITGQETVVRPATLESGSFRNALESFVLSEDRFWEDMEYYGSPEEVVDHVRSTSGAIGLIPSSAADDLRGVDIVGLRRISPVVHHDILEIQAGRRLRQLDPTQIEDLMTGEISYWSEVGGPRIEVRAATPEENDPGIYQELRVTPVLFDTGTSYYDRLVPTVFGDELTPSARTIYVESVDEFYETVTNTPGAIGLIYSPVAMEMELPVVETKFIHHQRNLRLSFLLTPPSHAGETGGISTIIINTLVYVLLTLLFATPVGIAAAIYLVEYARQGILVRLLRIGTDTLAGIPSIIFGLFGLVVFSQFFGFKTGLISGTLTVTLMILPTVVRTSEEALKTVSRDLREGSMALGATKLQTIIRVVVPAATPGILTGMILAVGRAVGETAAVIYTMGSNMQLLQSFNSPVRVLTIHLYMLIREGISMPNAFASATILLIITFIVNFSTRRLISGSKAMSGKKG